MGIPLLPPASSKGFTPQPFNAPQHKINPTSARTNSLNYQFKTNYPPQQQISRPSGDFVPKEYKPTVNPNQKLLTGNPNIPREAPFRVPQGFKDPDLQPANLPKETPRPKTVPKPTPKAVGKTSPLVTGVGVGAVLGGVMAGVSGGDPIQGAVQGGTFAAGSVLGTALLTGVAVSAGIPTGGLGTGLVLGIGGALIGAGSSQFSGFLYQKAKEGLGFRDPDLIPDSSALPPVDQITIAGTAGKTNNYYHVYITEEYMGVFLGPLTTSIGPKNLFNDRFYITASNGQFTYRDIPKNGSAPAHNFVRQDGTSVQTDIAQGTNPNTTNVTNVTNNITINNNYGGGKTDNQNPYYKNPEHSPLLSNKTPVITPSNSQKLTPKANPQNPSQNKDSGNPQNNQEKGILKKQDFVGPEGSSWTLAKMADGTTVVSNFSGNANILNNSEFKKSIEYFNKFFPNSQSNKKSTGEIYQKEVEGEKLKSDNIPNIINTATLPNPEGLVNENNPTPTNNNFPQQTPNPTQANNPVASVAEKQQEQGEKNFNAVVNPPVNPPVPESKQDQDYLALLEQQNNLISMIALGAGATYLASQFANLNQGIANIPSQIQPSPCQWPNDRSTVLANQDTTNTNLTTANTTLGVVSNTQLVTINATTTATNATVNTINTTTANTATGVTALINTIGTSASTATNTLFGFATNAYKSLYLDRVYNALSILLQVHNTAMLSRNVGESIGYLLSSSLSIFGIKDENGSPLDIGEILGDTVTNFIKGILGEELYNGLSTNWKKLSAIYTAVVNIYDLILQNLSGIAEGLQIVGEYSGKIGNALKKGGVVLENAYEWMEENIRIKTGRLSVIERINENLESVENITSNLTEVTEIVSETGESVNTINEEVNNIKAQVNAGEQAKAEAETASKTASQSPEIANGDLITPEPD